MVVLRLICMFCLMVFLMSESWAKHEQFVDPLDIPSTKSDFAVRGNLVGIARAGDRLVAVGQMGHILFSDDSGKHWQQADVPVSTDLVAVYFSSARLGWAVGHDGVILHSSDAGSTWQQQASGRQLVEITSRYYSSHPAADEDEAAERNQALEQLKTSAPSISFLDVWFQDDKQGYAVGAFNVIFKTSDGGQTWAPWFERTENPRGYHLYSIRGDASGVYIAGELGLLMRLDNQTQRFVALNSPYNGSFFGVLVNDKHIIAYGLRGNAFVSENGGDDWRKLINPSDNSLTAAVWLKNGDALLVTQAGELMREKPDGLNLQEVGGERGYPSNSVAITQQGDALTIVGPLGIKQLQLN
jgi:photosystem II stability/assembly factor-like uncharacterized protein